MMKFFLDTIMEENDVNVSGLMDENKDLRFEIEQQLNIIEVSHIHYESFLNHW